MLYTIQNKNSDFSGFDAWKDSFLSNINTISDYSKMNLYTAVTGKPPLLVMDKCMVEEAQDNFRYHFRDEDFNEEFLSNLEVKWEQFRTKVEAKNTDAMGSTIINYQRLALKFIHRYNPVSNRWYLTVQLCEIIGDPRSNPDPYRRHEIFDLATHDLFFNIDETGIGTESDAVIMAQVPMIDPTKISPRHCPIYFDSVYFGANKVKKGRDVQSATISWQELLALRNDNNSAGVDASKFWLVFSSATSEADLSTENTYSLFPHGMVAYIKYVDGAAVNECLQPGNIVIGNFNNRAGDYNTLCPRRCLEYLCPIELLAAIRIP